MHIHHQHNHLHKRQFGFANGGSNPFGSSGSNDNPFGQLEDGVSNLLDGDGNNGFDQEQPDKREGDNGGNGNTATKVSLIYVTASKTFDGPVMGYTTFAHKETPQNTPQDTPKDTPKDTPTSKPSPKPETTKEVRPTPVASTPKETPKPPKTTEETTPAATEIAPAASESFSSQKHGVVTSAEHDGDKPTPTHSKTPLTDSIQVTSSPTIATAGSSADSSSTVAGVAAAGTSSSSPSASADSKDSGMSGSAKAGIAIGVILTILILAGAAFAFIRFRKSREPEEAANTYNEKSPFGDHAAAAAPPASAMRSITPPPAATSFGAVPAAAGAGAGTTTAAASSAPCANAQASNPANPFGNHAATDSAPETAGVGAASSGPAFSGGEKAAMGTAAAAGTGALVGAAVAGRDRENRQDGPKPVDVKTAQAPGPFAAAMAAAPSPTPSQQSFNSVVSGVSVASAAGGAIENVHRVQLDFKPSMDDELELRAGQMVRLLHEYDDGWALCIRLDRSQQGVVPRTCLSSRPMKPRSRGPGPNGPPRGPSGPGMRGPPGPFGPPGRGSPAPSNVPRSMSPALAPNQRSMSPGPYGGSPQPQRDNPMRHRSNSDNTTERRGPGIAGPSPMNPGQKPAVQSNNANFQLPIQIPRPLTPQSQASGPSTPVSRKPVPGQAS